ncbi:MAG: hypothetical protein K2W96_21440 [Gemmataceae bacterium]|nr:hypothetical protein [Gemmataceae bacterium]
MAKKVGGLVLVLLVAALAMGAGGPKKAGGSGKWVGAGPCNGNSLYDNNCPLSKGIPCGKKYQKITPPVSGETLTKFYVNGLRACAEIGDQVCQDTMIFTKIPAPPPNDKCNPVDAP